MPQSSNVGNLITALTKAQKEFKPVPKSKTGQEGLRKFKYADLADVVGMVMPILNKYEVFLSQPIVVDNSGSIRQTTRLQLGEEFIQTDGIKLADDVPGKTLGISVTYARRIDLNGLLGIAPDEDVDAPDLVSNTSVGAGPSGHSNLIRTATKHPPQKADTSANPEITDADLPKEMFEEAGVSLPESPLPAKARAVYEHMENFKPLTEARNTEIQNRLKELVTNKVLDRKKLALFLDAQHEGKKQFDVSAERWEKTMTLIEAAVETGGDAVKTLLKGSV